MAAPPVSLPMTVTPEPKSPPAGAALIDPDGDVVLIVPSGERKARFRINSSTLCVASPVFRAMFGRQSRFKEASTLAATRADTSHNLAPTEPLEITIEDDNPNALAVVLRIIHLKNYLVPTVLNEDQLYEIAVICDKYELSQAVKSWSDRWVPLLVPDEDKKPPIVVGHKWLFIFYVFERSKLFSQISGEIILTATTDELGALMMEAKDGTYTNIYIPDSIIRRLTGCRQYYIKRMMECVTQTLDKYMKSGSKTLQCKQSKKEEACDSLNLGFLLRAFELKGVYPEASSEVMQKSVKEFKGILENIGSPRAIYFGAETASATCSYCQVLGYSRQLSPVGYCSGCSKYPPGMTNHASCSPISSFTKDIQEIWARRFIMNLMDYKPLGERKDEDLWEYVVYE